MRYLITKVYNNLPNNKKNNELSRICRMCEHMELTDTDFANFVEDLTQLVERANAKYPRTTPLWVRKWNDCIGIALDKSDKSLSITLIPVKGSYKTIKTVIKTGFGTNPDDVA